MATTVHERLTFYCGGQTVVCDRLGAQRVDALRIQASLSKGPLIVDEYEGGPRWMFPVESTAVKYETIPEPDGSLLARR